MYVHDSPSSVNQWAITEDYRFNYLRNLKIGSDKILQRHHIRADVHYRLKETSRYNLSKGH